MLLPPLPLTTPRVPLLLLPLPKADMGAAREDGKSPSWAELPCEPGAKANELLPWLGSVGVEAGNRGPGAPSGYGTCQAWTGPAGAHPCSDPGWYGGGGERAEVWRVRDSCAGVSQGAAPGSCVAVKVAAVARRAAAAVEPAACGATVGAADAVLRCRKASRSCCTRRAATCAANTWLSSSISTHYWLGQLLVWPLECRAGECAPRCRSTKAGLSMAFIQAF